MKLNTQSHYGWGLCHTQVITSVDVTQNLAIVLFQLYINSKVIKFYRMMTPKRTYFSYMFIYDVFIYVRNEGQAHEQI